MKERVVVTGGAGFIGANLVRRLLREKAQVHIFVRREGSRWRLNSVLDKLVVHEDVLDNGLKIKDILKKITPTTIYHLATYGSYPSQQDVMHMIQTNIVGTVNLLMAVLTLPYKQLVVVGSSSEYGDKEKPMEETDALEPNNFYGASKASQTSFCQAFAHTYRKPLIIMRLFNVYGYYEERGRLVRSVIEAVLKRKPILLANGNEARDLIFIDDVLDALLLAGTKISFFGEIFNIGTGRQTSILTLAKKICSLAKVNVPIKLGAYKGRTWDTTHWRADVRKAKTMLGWQPKHTLAQGLTKTIEWYSRR